MEIAGLEFEGTHLELRDNHIGKKAIQEKSSRFSQFYVPMMLLSKFTAMVFLFQCPIFQILNLPLDNKR